MAFDRKIVFPEEEIQAESTSIDLHSNVYEKSMDGIAFLNLNTSDVSSQAPYRPAIQTFFTDLNTVRDALHNVRKVLYFPQLESDGTAIDASVLDGFLAFSFEGGASCLVKTVRAGTWISSYSLATSPFEGGVVTTYELKKIVGGDLSLDGEVVSWLAASESDWDNSVFPAGFSNEPSVLEEKTVWAELGESGSSIDFNLVLGAGSREETLVMKTRYLPTILDRTSFLHEGKEYRILNIDRIGRKQFLNLTGVDESEAVTDGT